MAMQANKAYSVTARQTITFAAAGITVQNTSIIYEANGQYRSYRPGYSLNAITGFQAGVGYLIYTKQVLDLGAIVIPPLPADVPTSVTVTGIEYGD